MPRRLLRSLLLGGAAGGFALLILCGMAAAQPGATLPFDLSAAVHVDEADSAARAHLERVDAFLADRQWDEAVETLRRLMESSGEGLVRIEGAAADAFTRYVPLSHFCQMRLAAWAADFPEALALYRERADGLAQRWLQEALAKRDELLLRQIVDERMLTRWGDDALWALGEIHLGRGDYAGARDCWERISPALRAPPTIAAPLVGRSEGPLWLAVREALSGEADDLMRSRLQRPSRSAAIGWLAYPDTAIDLAAARARLAWVSILEGSLERAAVELELLRRLHPGAQGLFGGREVDLAAAVAEQLDQARQWPHRRQTDDWPTFAGNPARNGASSDAIDLAGEVLWRAPLTRMAADDETSAALGFGFRRLGEDAGSLLSYHPIVVGDLVFINDLDEVRAFQLETGRPPWPGAVQGVIYRPPRPPVQPLLMGRRQVGVPRMTLTAAGDRLFARMGSPVTTFAADEEGLPREPGVLVGLDLAAQGRLMTGFPLVPEDPRWTFEGSPLAAGDLLFVALRRSDVHPQAHVACYELSTGRLRWRRMVCSAETPAHTLVEEITHNLLTYHEGTLFYNTNLGAVASLRAEDGRINWVTVYPRSAAVAGPFGETASHYFRDLNPCVYHRSMVIVAPADSDGVFALDAATGQLVWQTASERSGQGVQATQILGVSGDYVLLSGDRLWWIDVASGRIAARFPDGGRNAPGHGSPQPRGFGRGLIAGDRVYWPTREAIYVFHGQPAAEGAPRLARQPIELEPRGASGGNLVAAGKVLLIATPNELLALRNAAAEDAAF